MRAHAQAHSGSTRPGGVAEAALVSPMWSMPAGTAPPVDAGSATTSVSSATGPAGRSRRSLRLGHAGAHIVGAMSPALGGGGGAGGVSLAVGMGMGMGGGAGGAGGGMPGLDRVRRVALVGLSAGEIVPGERVQSAVPGTRRR
jgi:hypothetical protein